MKLSMKSFSLVVLSGLAVHGLALADESVAPNKSIRQSAEDYIARAFDGSSVTLRARNQHNNAGALTKNQGQYIVDLKLHFDLTEDGRLKLRGRIVSGTKFDSNSNETGLGNNTTHTDDLNLRQLYLDYSPSKEINVQAGAVPVQPPGVSSGNVLSVDDDGWVDGVRGTYAKQSKWIDQVSVTVGRVDRYTDLNFLSRVRNEELSPNYLVIHVKGDISKYVTLTGELTSLADNQYFRSIVDLAVKDLVDFVDSVVVEQMMKLNDDTKQVGFAVSLKKAIGQFKVTTQYSFKSQEITVGKEGYLMLNDPYLLGHQLSLIVEHPVGKNSSITARMFKNLNHSEFLASNGLRAEVNYKYTWSRKKK